MKLPKIKPIFLFLICLGFVGYVLAAILFANRVTLDISEIKGTENSINVAIFGASGTAGDGILKSVMASPYVAEITVVTRRITPRMEAGIESGRLSVIKHMDYLDYSSIIDQLADIEYVYWAIGITSIGTDQETYRLIHTDFPVAFVNDWLSASTKPEIEFQFVSSSDISDKSTAMWKKEKVRAEKALFELAADTKLKVIAHRPDYIGPTKEEIRWWEKLVYYFFKPVGGTVKASQIGQAMIEISIQGDEVNPNATPTTEDMLDYSNAYERR